MSAAVATALDVDSPDEVILLRYESVEPVPLLLAGRAPAPSPTRVSWRDYGRSGWAEAV